MSILKLGNRYAKAKIRDRFRSDDDVLVPRIKADAIVPSPQSGNIH